METEKKIQAEPGSGQKTGFWQKKFFGRVLMKRKLLMVMTVVLAVWMGTGVVFAQDRKTEIVLNVGTITTYGGELTFAGFAMAVGPQLNLHLTKGFMLSPEATLLTDFSDVVGLAGVTMNYFGKGFFIGAGTVLPVSITMGLGVGELLPKVHLGYHGRKISLSIYMISSFNEFFRYGLLGANLGYRF